ncbi:MAG: triose-phosphate isomerase [Rhodocyclaceae bacterium]|nr:triose-phosphate isomerase [Rhodocyclaceae bacterium]MBK9623255.1 triose-phosphate isomerase [Rhodocyclaceae bacterium]MBL0076646.1 triose-phosphate isomerase [Rhodocyclaceae bacterium]MBP6109838.1 triose-phosphate isomerase [Rhodocyclaceae bacterium]MBP6279859.1 triose-phosphate isomerase [Rhodocyclaceae bacterium]
MRTKLVAGNWKMNGSLASNAHLLSALTSGAVASFNAKLAVCVPYPYLSQANLALAGTTIALGAQDVSEHEKGAFTGEVSAAMLMDFGCRYVLVGHSERRSFYGDTDAVVAAKFDAACKAGLVPILCVGESLAEREAGTTLQVVTRQLDAVLAKSGVAALAAAVVAYEPVWAIGTGLTATPAQAQEVHAQIRARIATESIEIAANVQILYGGSMKPSNAAELLCQSDIDGGLIGGAALVAEDFLAIAKAA